MKLMAIISVLVICMSQTVFTQTIQTIPDLIPKNIGFTSSTSTVTGVAANKTMLRLARNDGSTKWCTLNSGLDAKQIEALFLFALQNSLMLEVDVDDWSKSFPIIYYIKITTATNG